MANQPEHRDRCGLTIQDRINQALTDTLPDIGQIDPQTKMRLTRLVKKGLMSKGRGGPYPTLKTVYAVAGFDFAADRKRHVEEAMRWAALDEQVRRQQRMRAVIHELRELHAKELAA